MVWLDVNAPFIKCFAEPLYLYGEGKYGLSAVKEIDVTREFQKLNEKTKECQSFESLEKCMKKSFFKRGFEKCKCTPFNLRDYFGKYKQVNLEKKYGTNIKSAKKNFRNPCVLHWA